MKDRQPTQPGRVKITPENGDAYFAVMEMADEPTELGTPPIKENLLRDETETALFGNIGDRTVNDAFFSIAAKLKLISSDMATITLTVKSTNGLALPGVQINGAYDENGAALITGRDGTASGYVSEGSVTLSVSGYADIVDYSETFTAAKGQSYTKAITLTTRNFLKLTTSKSVKFSGNTTRVDVSAVGGGGGGGGPAWTTDFGVGGGGGYCVTQENVPFELQKSYSAVIGAGGNGASSPSSSPADGGTTTFMGITANGGKKGGIGSNALGAGNGVGGFRSSSSNREPTNGTVPGYSSFTETVNYGGGGQGAYVKTKDGESSVVGNSTSSTYGGKAGKSSTATAGKDGFGGGGACSEAKGTRGGSGCVAIRMHLNAV